MINIQDYGTLIRQAREQKNLKAHELAKQLGISNSAVSQWEKNKKIPSAYYAYKLSVLLEIPIEKLCKIRKSKEIKEIKTE